MKTTLISLTAIALTAVVTTASAQCVVFNAFGVHDAKINISIPNSITVDAGGNAKYHWNKSNWAGRTGQKAFYSTIAFNGLPVSTISTISWDVDDGFWGNAYFNVMVEDSNGLKAILAPSNNSSTNTGWGDMGATKNYAIFEAEAGWTGTAATGWNAATWAEVKDLIITDGPFTEFPDTLNGDATMQDDPSYTVANWAAWADKPSGADLGWEKGGFMITFGQSTGSGIPLTTISSIAFGHANIACMDLRPNSAFNKINTRSKALVPVALLGSAGFDTCAEVDLASILMRGAKPLTTKWKCDDVDGDGYDDFIMYFRARSLDKPTADECANSAATITLTGSTLNADPIYGSDFVSWHGPDCD